MNCRKPLVLLIALIVLIAFRDPVTHAQSVREASETRSIRAPRGKTPPSPPLSLEQALASFKLPAGYRIDPVVIEPMVEVPIIAQFDPDGRLWVVEMRGFMPNLEGAGEDQPAGRIAILDDLDGDGRMDRRTVFLDGLIMPRALLLAHGGVLVCEPPRLWFYPNQGDKPGPGVLVAEDFAKEADPKLGVLTNPEHSGNSLLLGLDNWIYSLYHPYRYRRVAGTWIREPNLQRVQWGLSQDDFGRLFYTSNSDQLRGDVVPSHYFAGRPDRNKPGIGLPIATDQSVWPIRVTPGVNRGDEPGTLRPDGTLARFTAACGTCIYRGALMPELQGDAFVCEPAANVIRRNRLSEKDGLITATNAYSHGEFLASSDELFRPVNLTTGPDGALYIVDMYHGIIQHRVYMTAYLRAQTESRGLQNVTNRGRIWRVGPTDRTPAPKPALSRASPAELVAALSHSDGWWRDTAQRLLVERNDPQAAPALEQVVLSSSNPLNGSKSTNPLARLHALWTLEGLSKLSPAVISAALADRHPNVRAAGVRLAESFARAEPGAPLTRAKLLSLSLDPSPEVRVQLALSLGELGPASDLTEHLSKAADDPAARVRDVARYVLDRRTTSPAAASAPAAVAEGRPLTPSEKKLLEAGRTMYEATCLACHQQHGQGQPGLAPTLVGSEWVSGSPARLIRIVLHGLRGPITVKGETFELDMPALGVLDDDQIASALTYIRREWGHTFDPVDPAMVKKVRDETETREDAWTQAELFRIP